MNERFGITERSLKLLFDAMSAHPEIEEVILFGSRAKGNYRRGSDIDLAIKGNECNAELALKLSGYVNEELPIPYHVDIVDYGSIAHQELKDHIDRVGICVFRKG